MNDKTLSIIIKAQDQASRVLETVGDTASRVGDRIFGMAKVASIALATTSVAAAGFAIKSAASFEQTRIGLENMLGSADSARNVLAQVSKFAAQTPFEFPELASSVKQLVAFGFTGEDSVKTMKQLGDVSAAIGAPIGDLSYLMGTLKTQGRAFTIDIRQFAQRGVPIYEYLAKVFNTNTTALTGMIEAGKVGFPEVQKAFELMTSEGGKFHGAMAKQSLSVSGLFSTLKDNISQTGRELVGINSSGDIQAGSLMDRMKTGTTWLINNLPNMIGTIKATINELLPTIEQWASNVGKVAEQVGSYLGPKFEALWTTISTKLVPVFEVFWRNYLEPLIPVLGTLFVAALGGVLDGFNGIVTALAWLMKGINDGNPIIWGLIGVFGVLATSMLMNGALNALTIGFETLRLVTIPSLITSLGVLKAAVITPMIMPAIAIGAALIALDLVYNKAQQTLALLDSVTGQQARALDSNSAVLSKANQDYKSGKISKDRYNSMLQAADPYHRAGGGPVTAGQPYIVGENEPELFVPNQSGQILNQSQMAGMGGTTVHIYGNISNTSAEAANAFWDRVDQTQRLARMGMA